MIYIITAMYAEARAFITRFQLKKDISHTRFQVFLNNEASICLIISGTGSLPAAVAVSSICTKYDAGQGDFLLNVGVCAQIRDKNGHRTEEPCQTGKIFLCSKIRDLAAGKTFYPDILYRHKFAEAQIITGPAAYEKLTSVALYSDCDLISQHMKSSEKMPYATTYSDNSETNFHTQPKAKTDQETSSSVTSPVSDQTGQHTEPYAEAAPDYTKDAEFCLYDMEAAAVYQAGSYYFGPHQMIFIKIVSDNGNAETVTSGQISHLIDRNLESIAEYITNLQAIVREEYSDEIFHNDSIRKELEKLCLDLHCSRVMSESVRQYIRYCILSGVDYTSILDEMYRDGTLPCKDKREGKQRFEELKERLL